MCFHQDRTVLYIISRLTLFATFLLRFVFSLCSNDDPFELLASRPVSSGYQVSEASRTSGLVMESRGDASETAPGRSIPQPPSHSMARTAVREGLLPESFEAVGRSAPQTLPGECNSYCTFTLHAFLTFGLHGH